MIGRLASRNCVLPVPAIVHPGAPQLYLPLPDEEVKEVEEVGDKEVHVDAC